VSLVSVLGGNWCYLCETVERVAEGETVEIATIHAGLMQVDENMLGCPKELGEYQRTAECPSKVVLALVKGRTFFFFSYEGLRLKLPQVAQTSVPCDSTCTIAGNVRAAAQPVMQPYLNAFPLPNGPEIQSQFGTAQFNASYANSASLNAYSLRLDHELRDKLTVFGRYDYSPSDSSSRGGGVGGPALSNLQSARIKVQTGTAGVTWMLSPTASDDFRFNYSRVSSTGSFYLDGFGGATPLSTFPFPAPYSTINSSFSIGIYTLTNPGLDAGKLIGNLQRQLNFVNSFSLSRGAHNLKFGIDYRRLSPLDESRAITVVGT